MIKKIFTKKHVFLVIEDENHNHSDAVFGKSILLSIYVGVNKNESSTLNWTNSMRIDIVNLRK